MSNSPKSLTVDDNSCKNMNIFSENDSQRSESPFNPTPITSSKSLLDSLTRDQIAMVMVAISLGLAVFPNLAMSYFFKETLHLNLAEMSFFNSLLNFIWILKPLFGFIADSYPIFGSHRRAYLIIFSLFGALGWFLLASWVETLAQAFLIRTLINISTSFCNVVGEGIMVTSSQKVYKAASKNKQTPQSNSSNSTNHHTKR